MQHLQKCYIVFPMSIRSPMEDNRINSDVKISYSCKDFYNGGMTIGRFLFALFVIYLPTYLSLFVLLRGKYDFFL